MIRLPCHRKVISTKLSEIGLLHVMIVCEQEETGEVVEAQEEVELSLVSAYHQGVRRIHRAMTTRTSPILRRSS
jgi:hypothetical protein